MIAQQGVNLLVFRPGRRFVHGAKLKAGLLNALARLGDSSSDAVLSSLLRAGELECGVADSGFVPVEPLAELTDYLAEALIRHSVPDHLQKIKDCMTSAVVPVQLSVSAPEGFAYYGLHPLAFAQVLDRLTDIPPDILVVGIRSIGTTLSAVASAAARMRGFNVKRITVRPGGHPYNRQTQFTPDQLALVQSAAASGAAFLVVDEGPGLSGSSFLSVAEALEKAGAAPTKIVLLCGHEPEPEVLCSMDAARRWRRFRHLAVDGGPQRPAAAEKFIGAGQWRSRFFHNESNWPESWTSMERLKYLSAGEPRRLFKFMGLGHYGGPVLEREQAVAGAGFGPEPRHESDGFASYPWLDGRAMSACDLFPGTLARLAEYCAFRVKAFPMSNADPGLLQEMAEHNLHELKLDVPVVLRFEQPVIADGHMQPHEWLLTDSGEMLKTDSGGHGDDHFFPGPTDIAWDLAGAIVEWQMNAAQAKEFLERYRHASGDDAAGRIGDFVRAYAVFRCAYCRMAANAMQGSPEQLRMEVAVARYAAALPALRAASGQ